MGFQADISGCEVVRPANTEVTSLGAAYIAGLSSGFWKNLDEVRGNVKVDRVFFPEMSEEQRESLLEGWRRAVKKSRL